MLYDLLEIRENVKSNAIQSPVVPVMIEKNEAPKVPNISQNQGNNQNFGNNVFGNHHSSLIDSVSEVSMLNSKKKIVSRVVEITVKTIYTYEDGSKKETTETENHTFSK